MAQKSDRKHKDGTRSAEVRTPRQSDPNSNQIKDPDDWVTGTNR
jgi:hypothetical protein